MNDLSKYVGPATWAYAIIVGGMLITPGGIVPIVTKVLGFLGIALGATAFYIRKAS